jgi:radical SAM protein with 4Fe4S-binding SPASM domain
METDKDGKRLNYRFENFGGIIANNDPPFLAFVSRDYMKELGLGESALWNTSDESIGLLSAPTEVHFSITEKCSVRCQHCYVDAGKQTPGELDVESLRRALDILSVMKVFHIAFAGGDATERPELFELAEYARSNSIVPNFTVSGINMNPEIAQKMRIFGQVNVSIDGVGEKYGALRPQGMFKIADKAVDLLFEAGVPTGINCLVTRSTFEGIEELFKYAKAKKANHISFLRFKPAGRAKRFYEKEKITRRQKIDFMPILKILSKKYNLNIKTDCSFMPMICYHRPPLESFETMASYGCEAGNVLMGMKSNGQVTACSFLNNAPNISIFELQSTLQNHNCFDKIRNWPQTAVEPCKSCEYLNICKGGCHSVAEYITGSLYEPDPECPFVEEYKNKHNPIT